MGTLYLMDSESEVIDEKAGTSLVIPQSVQRAAGDVVHQAFERLLSSDVHVTTATEGKRLLAEDDNTEQSTDAIQRFVGIATPVVRVALRGARFTRIPWVLVASTSVSIGVTVRAGVRELQVLAALLAHRFKEETGAQPDAALLRKLTLELYLRPRRPPNVSGVNCRSRSLGTNIGDANDRGVQARPQPLRPDTRHRSHSRLTHRGDRAVWTRAILKPGMAFVWFHVAHKEHNDLTCSKFSVTADRTSSVSPRTTSSPFTRPRRPRRRSNLCVEHFPAIAGPRRACSPTRAGPE